MAVQGDERSVRGGKCSEYPTQDRQNRKTVFKGWLGYIRALDYGRLMSDPNYSVYA